MGKYFQGHACGQQRSLVLALALTVVVVGWSFNFIAGKIALRHLNPLALASFRIELAAVILLLLYSLRPRKRALNIADLRVLAALGFLGVVMNSGLFTVGLAFTTSGHSSIVLACGPILVLLLACVEGLERLTVGKMLGMGLSFAGVVILAAEQGLSFHSRVLMGDVITLVGSAGFALYTVFGKKVAERYDSLSMNTFNNVAGAILLLPIAFYQGMRLNWRAVGWEGWLGMAYMAAVSSVVTYLIYYWALRHMAASRVAAISYVQPLLVIVLAVAFLGEHVSRSLVLGAGLVLTGVYVTEHGSV